MSDKVQFKVMKQIDAFKIQERKKKKKQKKRERGKGEKLESQRGSNRAREEERDSRLTLLYFHSLLKMSKEKKNHNSATVTAANRV